MFIVRWVCTSADPNDLDKTDEIATTVLEDIINEGGKHFRGLDTLGRYFTTYAKGDNFGEFLFASPHTKILLKQGLL